MDLDDQLRGFDGFGRLFPLPELVMFPHAILPLHIFEPRYRRMTEDALAGDRLITMVQIRGGCEADQPLDPPIERFGCIGKILECERLPDGRFNFLLVGCKRARIVRELPGPEPYRVAELELVEDRDPAAARAGLREELVGRFRRVLELKGSADPELVALLASDQPLGALTDILAHSLAMPGAWKQALLEEPDVGKRAARLSVLLGKVLDQAAALGLGSRRFPPPFSAN